MRNVSALLATLLRKNLHLRTDIARLCKKCGLGSFFGLELCWDCRWVWACRYPLFSLVLFVDCRRLMGGADWPQTRLCLPSNGLLLCRLDGCVARLPRYLMAADQADYGQG